MATRVRSPLVYADGYRVVAQAGKLGLVEEIWVGESDEPSAMVVRLQDGQRGLLELHDVAVVDTRSRTITLTESAHLLRLDPPHVDASNGEHVASWRATDEEIPLPNASRKRGEPSLAQNVLVLYSAVAFIVGTLIGLDFLIAYLISGHWPV